MTLHSDPQALQSLYQELIIDHGTQPRNHYVLDPFTHQAEGYNPLCGDQLHLFIDFDSQTHIIKNISFTGSGCAISMASASLLTETLKHKNLTDIKNILSNLYQQLIPKSKHSQNLEPLPETIPEKLPEKLNALMGVRTFPTRIKCATLAWHAVEEALSSVTLPILTPDSAPVAAQAPHFSSKSIPVTLKTQFSRTDSNGFEPVIVNAGDPGLTDLIIDSLKTIFDPELPVNIYDLGLINELHITANNHIEIKLTLTTPGCPVAQTFPQEIKQKLSDALKTAQFPVQNIQVTLTWDPPWSPNRLSDGVKLQLGLL